MVDGSKQITGVGQLVPIRATGVKYGVHYGIVLLGRPNNTVEACLRPAGAKFHCGVPLLSKFQTAITFCISRTVEFSYLF
jgi:hypothetical protein